ncbi:MAG TPA: DUF6048 family protein [Edaphocola sp.]|nr:DUF6048 family protein [Edaphocola sp.]
MSWRRKIVFCFCCLLWAFPVMGQSPADSGQAKAMVKKLSRQPEIHQVTIGFDFGRILFNNLFPSRKGYEMQVDYNWSDNLYFAAETGWGRGKIDYAFLKYTTKGTFIRLGVNKTLLGRLGPNDFDNAFIGVRYGMGFGHMSDAAFSVSSPFGGSSDGEVPGQNYFVHWGELVGGLKVGFWHNLYAGWTVRGKFLFNPGTFGNLSPNYIPGFGKGDKNTIFDFNFYLSYGIQWRQSK